MVTGKFEICNVLWKLLTVDPANTKFLILFQFLSNNSLLGNLEAYFIKKASIKVILISGL